MNIKKEVFLRIKQHLQDEHNRINAKLRHNKYEFKKLTEEQTILKSELTELTYLINYCEKRKDLEANQ